MWRIHNDTGHQGEMSRRTKKDQPLCLPHPHPGCFQYPVYAATLVKIEIKLRETRQMESISNSVPQNAYKWKRSGVAWQADIIVRVSLQEPLFRSFMLFMKEVLQPKNANVSYKVELSWSKLTLKPFLLSSRPQLHPFCLSTRSEAQYRPFLFLSFYPVHIFFICRYLFYPSAPVPIFYFSLQIFKARRGYSTFDACWTSGEKSVTFTFPRRSVWQ